ncbi:nitrogen metabolic regulation protein nmr [Apodospora peruviana]|uniref:Nitrogen metabolic regulation protein nmr n=1 Tax=Apodospora peruviana TaxID=516989 RepID=A0AAE0MCU5_9PEZI|nr:nitrogen metabolic regulation protein nmr [Apodospora peruviana]
MPAELISDLAIRPAPKEIKTTNGNNHHTHKHKHSRSSYSELSPLTSLSRNGSWIRPFKRPMPNPDKTIAVINASGRQAASFIRVATAVGYHVRAQLRNLYGVVATEVATNPNVTVLQGELYTKEGSPAERARPVDIDVTKNGPNSGIGVNHDLIKELFKGAQLAFINTTFYGNEQRIGEALADAAKAAGIQHYIYSSMPDHHAYDDAWPSLPLWASKHKVEEYVRQIGLPATFVYTGIYNNNFTSLPYPLFCTDLQPDGSWIWQAPFHPDAKLPWLDAEHDVGPAILQIFKDGVRKWGNGKRVALAYEMLTPKEVCRVFSRGVGKPIRYVRGPIEIKVKIPEGYRIQLEALEELFSLKNDDPAKQPPYFGDRELEESCPQVALELWEGPRGMEEYAREVFPLEEQANGLTWMLEDGDHTTVNQHQSQQPTEQHENGAAAAAVNGNGNGSLSPPQETPDDEPEGDEEDDDDDGLVMRGLKRDDEEWLA